jgi:DNA-binding transcriptional MerR regulator
MTAHEDPDHGKGHCHHAWSVEGCYACWNQLPNDEIRHRLSSQEVVELVGEAKTLRGWAQERGITLGEIPSAFDRVSRAESARISELTQQNEGLQAELERLGTLLREAIAQLPRKKQGRFR